MKTLIKRASATLAGGALAFSGLAVVSAAPAAAAASPIDVTSIRVAPSYGGTAISASSKYYNVGTSVRAVNLALLGDYGSLKVYGDVYRGSTRVFSNVQLGYYYQSTGGQNWSTSFAVQNRWGRGTFRIANVRVVYNNGSSGNVTAADTAVAGGTFAVKSALKASGKVRYWYGSSKKVANIKLQRYLSNGRYYAYKTKVKLQRKQGGKWRTVKTLKLNRKGKAKYTFRSSKKYKYRFVVKANSTTAGGVFTTYGKA